MHPETLGHDNEPRSSDDDLVTQLLSVSRYIAAEALIASALHAINHQLAYLHTRTQTLLREPRVRENHVAREVLMDMNKHIEGCVEEIDRARSFVAGSRNVEILTSCDVHAEIIQTAEMWTSYLRSAKCELRLQLDALESHARIAPQALREIMAALLVNAVQARSKAVTVTTSVRENLWISDIYTLRLALQIMIQDNGVGPSCIRTPDEMFAPGYTTKPRAAGLGLFVARTLARRAGGELSYSGSLEKRGAVFSLALPITDQ